MSGLNIQELFHNMQQTLSIMSVIEIVAVVLALAYLILAIQENSWCWICGFSSTLIYLMIFWKVSLYSETLLQIFYLFMSGYGWIQWTRFRSQSERNKSSLKPIIKWTIKRHLKVISITSIFALLIGTIMSKWTSASFPYIDAATTCFAIVSTYMVAQKVFENWFYWIVVDSVSVYLFLNKGLYFTAVLFALYVLLCIFGIIAWRRHLIQQDCQLVVS